MNNVDKWLVHAVVLLRRQCLITEHIVRKPKAKVLATFERSDNNGKQSIQDVLRIWASLIDSGQYHLAWKRPEEGHPSLLPTGGRVLGGIVAENPVIRQELRGIFHER